MAIYRGPGGAGDATADASNAASVADGFADAAGISAGLAAASAAAASAAQVAAELAETNAETAETNAETAEASAVVAKNAAEAVLLDAGFIAVAADLQGADNIGTVATDINNVNTVGTNIANINTVAGNNTNITTVAGDTADINTVADNTTNINIVAGNSLNITTVAGVSSDVTAVAGISTDVSTVSANNANVTIVATNISSVNTNATNIVDIQNASTNATNAANSASAALASQLAAEAAFDAFDDIYLGAKASDPLVDNDGSVLTTGDQYFNTVANELRVWNGSSWQAASVIGGTVTSLNVTGDTTLTNLSYTGTLTGGTGVVNLGSGQFYKDASGNVGVGTASPSAKLDIAGSLAFTNTGNRITGDFSNATHSNRVLFQSSTTNGAGFIGALPNGTSTSSGFNSYNNSDSNNANIFQSLCLSTESSLRSSALGTVSAIPLTFYTGGSERLRIDTSGNVGIGTSSPNGKLTVAAPSTAQAIAIWNRALDNSYGGIYFKTSDGATDQCVILNERSSTNGASLLFYTKPDGSASAERMRIDSSGNVFVGCTAAPQSGLQGVQLGNTGFIRTGTNSTATRGHIAFNNPNGEVGLISTTGTGTLYATSSDYRLKENIAPMTGALDVVQQLKPVTYNWKADGSSGQGFIAHELQAVVPECVTGEKDAVDEEGKPVYQGIDTSFLMATLTKAIQEQQSMIENLTTRLNALEGK